jgi:pimeloyl-ACP methyl ester carboxylesterase
VLVSPVYATAAAIASPAGRRLHRAQFDAVFKQRLTVASTAEPEITRQMANLVLRGVRPALREEVLRLICRLDSCPLQSIRVPLLVLRGSHDVGCAKAQSALLAARLPQATWVTRPTWNHFCHIHDPAGVAAVIKSWFATLAQPGSPLDSSQPKGPPP